MRYACCGNEGATAETTECEQLTANILLKYYFMLIILMQDQQEENTAQAFQIPVTRTQQVYINMRDPRLLKYYYRFNTLSKINGTDLSGSSPPDIFVGRFGYPYVYIGPLVPPEFGDTSVLANPEEWVGKSISDIVAYRSTLVRGMFKADVRSATGSGRVEDMLQELAIADKYTNVDMQLARRPSLNLSFDENSQPFGPSAPLKELHIGNTKANRQIEDAYFDTAMPATDAVIELYDKGVSVVKIQKAFSGGALGIGAKRRFVPTRWSITAVDDIISKHKVNEAKEYNTIDTFRVYETIGLDNRWLILMAPGEWSYELIEAWYPNTTWNMNRNDIAIYSSHEFFEGRKTYAEIGGCYYAARLAVSELFERIQKQAKVVIMREVHSGYTLPVGVWNTREHVRQALRQEPKYFDTLSAALGYISTKLEIPMSTWIKNSDVLKSLFYQKGISNYLS